MQCTGCAEWLDLPLNMNSIFWGAPANLQSFPLNQIETEWVSERETGREWECGRHLRRYSRLNQKMQIASTSASRGLSSVCWFSGLLGDATIFSSLLIFNTFVCCAPKGKTSCSKAVNFQKSFNGLLIRERHPSTLKLFWKIINFGTGCLPLVWKCLTVVWWITSP